MAVIAGKDGLVKIGSDTVAEVNDWSLDIGVDMLDAAAFGDQWEEFIAGIRNWSGSMAGNWYLTDTAQAAVQTAALGGTSVTLKLYVNASNFYSGTAFVESVGIKAAIKSTVAEDWKFKGSGALAYT